jgi:methylglyoxal reductase
MLYRRLGRTNLNISAVVYGAMALGSKTAAPSEESRTRALHAALDRGVNAIDTAPLYEFGGSEKLLGRALAGRRDSVVLMSKVGLRWDDPRGLPLFEFEDSSGARRTVRKNSRPDSLRWEVDQSLLRLGVEYLDLVQIHHPDVEVPIADSIGTLLELRRAGKIREIGVSNFWPSLLDQTARALGDVQLASIQQELNLIERSAERDILPWARAHGAGVLVYSPLYKGLLTGRVSDTREFSRDDFRGGLPGFQKANRARVNRFLVSVVRPIADRHRVSIAQVGLAWVLAQAGVTAVIAGASTAEQARENAAAAEVLLSGIEILEIRTAVEAIELERGSSRLGLVGRLRSLLPL